MRLIPTLAVLAAVVAAVFFTGAPAGAQSTALTVSTVAITSDPGTDGTYATGDTVTVSVTFSEAVTVSTTGGTPRITLDFAGQPRYASYSGDGSSAAAQAFSYTVLVGDDDADGVSVLANSLALDGGTIQATDDSANATLTHSAMTFASHKVDTEVLILGNGDWGDWSSDITISATQDFYYEFRLHDHREYDLTKVTLNVTTPSDTLDVVVRVGERGSTLFREIKYTGSVATAGLQTFTLSESSVRWANIWGPNAVHEYYIIIEGQGSGSIELEAKDLMGAGLAPDPTGNDPDFYYISSDRTLDPDSHIPETYLYGHEGAIPQIIYGEVVSRPWNGSAYAAGERIEFLYVLTRPVNGAESLTVPFWLGSGAQHRREAELVVSDTDEYQTLLFAYTVQPGDADSDGIYLGADPFGDNAAVSFHREGNTAVPAHIRRAADQLPAGQSVNGAASRTCREVLCSAVTVDGGTVGPLQRLIPTGVKIDEAAWNHPFERWGEASASTFAYDGELNAVAYLSASESGTLTTLMFENLPRSLVNRGAVVVDGSRYLFSEAFDHGPDAFFWFFDEVPEDYDLSWTPGDEVEVKIMETATASFDAATFDKVEGDVFDVTVSLDEAFVETTLTLPITVTTHGGATEADYTLSPDELVFAPGDTSKTFTVTVVDDTIDDDGESITLSFDDLHILSGGANETATIALGDNDFPVLTVEYGQDSQLLAEGETVQVTVRLSAPPEREVDISLTATGQAGAVAADYNVPTSVTFAEDETEKTVAFMAVDDAEDDDDETVKLGFATGLPERITAGTRNETTLKIDDNDNPIVTVMFAQTAYTVDEGGTQQVTVTVNADPKRTIIIPITATPQGTASAADYSVSPSVTFTDGGALSQTFTIEGAQDLIDDDNETVTLGFGTMPDPRVSAGTPGEATVTINDDDTADILFSPLEPAVTEADPSGGEYAVTLATEPTVEVTVTITGDAGTDLSLVNNTLTFTADDWTTPQTVRVTAAADLDSDNERVALVHTGGGAEYQGLARSLDVLVIDDDTGELRLVDGTRTTEDGRLCEGRLEIYINGQWGTICDDYWNDDEADVACRQLGFAAGSVVDGSRFNAGSSRRAGTFPPGDDDQPIWLDDVRCNGSESDLLECRHRRSESGRVGCRHYEDVGIRCVKPNAPWIADIQFNGPPGDDRYDTGETVEVTLVWNEAVDVTVPQDGEAPTMWLTYGLESTRYTATYAGGSGTDRTLFTYTVRDPTDYIRLMPDRVRARDGRITSLATGVEANLSHGHYLDRSERDSHQGAPARIVSEPAFNDPGPDGLFDTGEVLEVTLKFSEDVLVDTLGGSPTLLVTLGGTEERVALYRRGSGTNQLLFSYPLAERDGSHDTVAVLANSLALNGGIIRDVRRELNVSLEHRGAMSMFMPEVVAEAELGPDVETNQGSEDGSVPELQSATVDGSALTLTYDEDLDNSGSLSSGLFAVTVNGASRSVMGAGVGGSKVILLLSPAVEAGDTVTMDYTAPTDEGAARVEDTSGNAAASFSGQEVTNNTAPSETTKSVSGEQPGGSIEKVVPEDPPGAPVDLQVSRQGSGRLQASWSVPISGSAPTGYTVQWKESGGDWADPDDVSRANVTGTSHVITGLTDGMEYTVRVIATKGDVAGDPSGEISATPQETTPPALSTAAVDGALLTLTYNEALDAGETPAASAFAVTVGGNSRGIESVAVSGSTVTLTLATAVSAGDSVTVAYTAPTGDADSRLQDLAGNAAETFSGHEATNNTAEHSNNQAEPANNPATGDPAISGTAQVGQTLTVSTTGIADDDGLVNATFNYRWLADDAAIPDADSATYTLTTSQEGKAIKVTVSFTDDAGHAETLTSAATGAVEARPNSPATGTPTISGTPQVAQTLTADTSDIADADGLDNATFSYQWLADDTAIPNAEDASYTLTSTEQGKAIKLTVAFTDDRGHTETLTSTATPAVAAVPPDEPQVIWSVQMTVKDYGHRDMGASDPEYFSNETGDLDVVWLWYSSAIENSTFHSRIPFLTVRSRPCGSTMSRSPFRWKLPARHSRLRTSTSPGQRTRWSRPASSGSFRHPAGWPSAAPAGASARPASPCSPSQGRLSVCAILRVRRAAFPAANAGPECAHPGSTNE